MATAERQRQVLRRLPANPLDKSTIVSVLPKAINEYKPTIFPSRFEIPAAKSGDFELLVIEQSSWYMPNQNERIPPTEVQVSTVQLAQSIVTDYCNGIYLCNMKDIMPGLFWVPGSFNKVTIRDYISEKGLPFSKMLEEAREKQRKWFMAQVQSADELWVRSGGNPRAVSDDARLGAEVLQLKDKPWMKDAQTIQLINCKACGELINPNYPVCKHCHAIVDANKAKELDIVFADN